MKTILFTFALLFSFTSFSQIGFVYDVELMSSYSDVEDTGIITYLNEEILPFSNSSSLKKEVYLIPVDTIVRQGEERLFLESRGFTLLSDPTNFFSLVDKVILNSPDERIICPVESEKVDGNLIYITGDAPLSPGLHKIVIDLKTTVRMSDVKTYFAAEKLK